jgi:RimJ/RimL family protein N-acetyltransferase
MSRGRACPVIRTRRLLLVPCTPEQVRAQVDQMDEHDKAQMSPDWLARLAVATTVDPWVLGFSIVHEHSGDAIGSCGFKAPPDTDGVVEIAYGLAPAHHSKGYATEAAAALVRFALADPRVTVIRAHTVDDANASARVLVKCGFHPRGRVIDPEDGPVFRWEIECRT